MSTDRQSEETTTLQCDTAATTEAEELATYPPPTDLNRDCTCPSTETSDTEWPTLGTVSGIVTENKRGTDEQQKTEAVTCTALGGGLGTLAAIQMVILVGVVLGWVWSCHRKIKK